MRPCVLWLLALCACAEAPPPGLAPGADGWHEFQGSWTASGTVRTLALGDSHQASIADLKGTMVLAGPSRPGIGFRGDAIAFTATGAGMVGRAVWTDERGDRIFSELRGGGPAKGSKVAGTFIGGTGRYAGATGTYQFTWQSVIADDEGTVHGRAVGLSGRVRTNR